MMYGILLAPLSKVVTARTSMRFQLFKMSIFLTLLPLWGFSADEKAQVRLEQDKIRQEFVAANRKAIAEIKQNLGPQYLNIDWQKLESQLESIEIEVLPPGKENFSHERKTANYHRGAGGSKKIQFNSLFLEQTDSETKPSLYLHELLGVSGINDQNYQISLSTKLLLKNPKKGSAFDLSRFPKIQSLQSGGVTVVSGGGDSFELLLKEKFIREILDTKAYDSKIASELGSSSQQDKADLVRVILLSKIDFRFSQSDSTTYFKVDRLKGLFYFIIRTEMPPVGGSQDFLNLLFRSSKISLELLKPALQALKGLRDNPLVFLSREPQGPAIDCQAGALAYLANGSLDWSLLYSVDEDLAMIAPEIQRDRKFISEIIRNSEINVSFKKRVEKQNLEIYYENSFYQQYLDPSPSVHNNRFSASVFLPLHFYQGAEDRAFLYCIPFAMRAGLAAHKRSLKGK